MCCTCSRCNLVLCHGRLPHLGRAIDGSRQKGLLRVSDCRQPCGCETARLESGCVRCPVKECHVPCERAAAALVVDEAVIKRTLCRNQSTERQLRIVDRAGALKPVARFGDVASNVEFL